MAVGEIH
jgi:hypothetical protein